MLPQKLASLLPLLILITISAAGFSAHAASCIDNTWEPVSNINAPTARDLHTAVWTGTEMIIWGGINNFCCGALNTGARYNPSTNTWRSMSTVNAPSGRFHHTAVWTGSKMIVWGGFGPLSNEALDTGGLYDPLTDTWTATSTIDVPAARQVHSAVWTGKDMIIWGGETSQRFPFDTGAKYDPVSDSWSDISTTNVPIARAYHTAVWTGDEMLIWGGLSNATDHELTGGSYNPDTNTWSDTDINNAPEARYLHSAIWSDKHMIVWGGLGGDDSFLNTGSRYYLRRDGWRDTAQLNAPTPRRAHTAVWTGTEMIIWGGNGDVAGGRFQAIKNRWTPTTTSGAPDAREFHTAVWTGTEMIVWGGSNFTGLLSNGARYCAN